MKTKHNKVPSTLAVAAAMIVAFLTAGPAQAQFSFTIQDGNSAIPGGGAGSSFTFNNFGSQGYLSCGLGNDPSCLIEINLVFNEGDEGDDFFTLEPLDDEPGPDPVLIRYRTAPGEANSLGIVETGETDEATSFLVEVLASDFDDDWGGTNPYFIGPSVDPQESGYQEIDGTTYFDVTIVVPSEAEVTGAVTDITVGEFPTTCPSGVTSCPDVGDGDSEDGALTREFLYTSDWIIRVRVSVNSPATPVLLLETTADLCHNNLQNENPSLSPDGCEEFTGATLAVGVAPEPGPLVLLGIGLAALGLTRLGRRRRG